MALYEIVLRFPNHDEVRLSDRGSYEPGDEIVIDYRPYVVVAAEPPESPNAATRWILEPRADGQTAETS